MNILVISKYITLPGYGPGARLYHLANYIRQAGNDVTIITSDSNHLASYPEYGKTYNSITIDSLPVILIKTLKYKKSASARRFLSWLDFELKLFRIPQKSFPRPDVIIVSSLSILSIIYGYYLKKKTGAKLVFEIRDIWPLTMTEEGNFSRWHPLVLLIGWIEKFGYKKSDLIVGTMPGLYLHVQKIIGHKKPFFCAPLGFEPRHYTSDPHSTENPFKDKIPENKIIVGYAGSMGITNALDEFIDAIMLLQNENKIHFVLAGAGDLRSTYEKKLADCNNVTFFPKIPQDDVKYLLQCCDILYLSTKDSKVWDYGQSMNKVVEYMLAGKPILARYNGYPSMINEAGCGIILPENDKYKIADAIVSLANKKPAELKMLGENGRTWILENRSYPKLATEYLRELKKLLEPSLS